MTLIDFAIIGLGFFAGGFLFIYLWKELADKQRSGLAVTRIPSEVILENAKQFPAASTDHAIILAILKFLDEEIRCSTKVK